MSANNNIWQGVRKFSIGGQQNFCYVWEKSQDFGKFEEPLCQGKLVETES